MAVDVQALYEKYGPMVIRRCRQLLKNEEMAIDAAQDTFVKILRYRQRLHGGAPSSLLYRIATNVCLNVLRKERRTPVTHDERILDAIAGSDNDEERFAARESLRVIFHSEKPSTEVIAVLYYLDRMTYEEVAAEVGLSVSGVRKRLAALSRRIKEQKEVLL